MADEFEIIERYFTTPEVAGDGVWLGVGDDAAVLDVPPGRAVVGEMRIHPIPDGEDGFAFGSRALRDALASSRARGATPRWITLALTLPKVDTAWLEGLHRAIRDAERSHRVRLVGGDTTRGPGALAICVLAVQDERAPGEGDIAGRPPHDDPEGE